MAETNVRAVTISHLPIQFMYGWRRAIGRRLFGA